MSSVFKFFFYFYEYLIVLFYIKWGDFIAQYVIKTLSTSFRSRHNKSLKHVNLSHSVVNRYNLDNIKVEHTNNILDKHINGYKKKFVRFQFSYKISSIIIRDYPKHILFEKN